MALNGLNRVDVLLSI